MKQPGKKTPVPHLFSKLIVWWCILFGTGACYYALRIESRTDKSPTGTLVAILGFLGGELMLLCMRTVLKERPANHNNQTVSNSDTEEKGDG